MKNYCSSPYAFLLLIFSVILFTTCGVFKKDGSASIKKISTEKLIKKVTQNQVKADWFTAKTRINYKGKPMSMKVSGTIRLQKDEQIWISIKKFGFEVARARITKDSVFVLDRFNKIAYLEDYSYLTAQLKFPVNFSIMQSLVLGNPVFFTKMLNVSLSDSHYLLSAERGKPLAEYQFNPAYLTEKMTFSDPVDDRKLEYALSDYKEAGGQDNFSYFRKLNLNSKETDAVSAEIEFYNIEFDVPQKMPFEIPGHYKKSDE